MASTISCTNVEIEKIRARVKINDYIIETPYVKSISVNKSRSSNIGTFSATIELPVNVNIGTTSGQVEIYAGTKNNYLKRRIFTGVIRQVVANPCPGKPNYMLLNISGRDMMYKLENKKFSRRIKSDGPGVFVVIEGSRGARPSSVWSIDKRIRSGSNKYTGDSPALYPKEPNELIKGPSMAPSHTWLGPLSEIVPEPGKTAAGLNIHDHSSQNKGGPAFGSYSIS